MILKVTFQGKKKKDYFLLFGTFCIKLFLKCIDLFSHRIILELQNRQTCIVLDFIRQLLFLKVYVQVRKRSKGAPVFIPYKVLCGY